MWPASWPAVGQDRLTRSFAPEGFAADGFLWEQLTPGSSPCSLVSFRSLLRWHVEGHLQIPPCPHHFRSSVLLSTSDSPRHPCWFCSVDKSCPALCGPMDYSTPGFLVLHCLPVCSDPCPLSWRCHPSISSSAASFSSCFDSFPMSHLFASGGQSIGASTLASVLPMNTQD